MTSKRPLAYTRAHWWDSTMLLLSSIVERRVSQLILRNYTSRSTAINMSEKSFLPKKALVLRKFSRLEYERLCHSNLTEEQLAANVSAQSTRTSLTYRLVRLSLWMLIQHLVLTLTCDHFKQFESKLNFCLCSISSANVAQSTRLSGTMTRFKNLASSR